MKTSKAVQLCSGGVLLFSCAFAVAHHSPAVFDRSQRVTVTGTVREFTWQNPHSWIHLDVADDASETTSWTVEMNPATLLARGGWRASSLKPGDEISVIVHPLRNGERGGQFISVTLPDGKVLGEVPAELGRQQTDDR
jgi:hypothetical protein